MTQPIRLASLLGALNHHVELITHGFVRLGMLTGLFTIFIFVMPVVIALNLLTKLVSATAELDWRDTELDDAKGDIAFHSRQVNCSWFDCGIDGATRWSGRTETSE